MKKQLLIALISCTSLFNTSLAQDTIITRKKTVLTGEIEDVQLARIIFKSREHGNSRVKISRLRVKEYSWNTKHNYPQYKGIEPIESLFRKGALGFQVYAPGFGASLGFYNKKKNLIWEHMFQLYDYNGNYKTSSGSSFIALYNPVYETFEYNDYSDFPVFNLSFKSNIKYFIGQKYRRIKPYFAAGISTGVLEGIRAVSSYAYAYTDFTGDYYNYSTFRHLSSNFFLGITSGLGLNFSICKNFSISAGIELIGLGKTAYTQERTIIRKDGSQFYKPSEKVWKGDFSYYAPLALYYNF